MDKLSHEKVARKLRQASERLREQQETIEKQSEKLAAKRRREAAEDIVEAKIAAGNASPADFVEEREALVESDKDLEKVKVAMQEAGPGFASGSLVEPAPEKEATSTGTESSSGRDTQLDDARSQLHDMAREMNAA